MMQNRIDELEIKLSYQEDTISQLNDVIIAHQFQIKQLEEKLDLLSNLLKKQNMNTEPTSTSHETIEYEIPPHY